MSDSKDLISVYQGANTTEAHFVMNLLLDDGIEAVVSEENEPLAGLSIAAPDVYVRREDEVRARAIIERYDNEQLERANRPAWRCPECGHNVIGALDECDRCGHVRPGSDFDEDDEDDDGSGDSE